MLLTKVFSGDVRLKSNLFVSIITKSSKFSQFHRNMSKPAVYVTRNVNKEAIDLLKKHSEVTIWEGHDAVPRDEFLKNVENKDALFVLITEKVDAEVLDRAGKKLKVVGTMSVGYDHLDIQELKKRNIRIGYTPRALTEATAELTVALLLATSRRLLESNEAARTGEWKTWAPFWMCGPGLHNSTVGIFGFGRIGQAVARMLCGFRPKRILYYDHGDKREIAQKIGAECVTFDELLAQSDFISVHAALTPETKNIFNKQAFSKMKPSSVFINTSRGGLVAQDDLVEALTCKTIWGAGLDVMVPEPLPNDNPLFKLKNCVILPHIGSASTESRNSMGLTTAQNIVAALTGGQMPDELIVK